MKPDPTKGYGWPGLLFFLSFNGDGTICSTSGVRNSRPQEKPSTYAPAEGQEGRGITIAALESCSKSAVFQIRIRW